MNQNDIIIELLTKISNDISELKDILKEDKHLRESKLPRSI